MVFNELKTEIDRNNRLLFEKKDILDKKKEKTLHLKTPPAICNRLNSIEMSITSSKNKKRKQLEKERSQILVENPTCKNEAKVYEDDAHDDHTVESYMIENAALIAALAAKSLTEMKEEYSTEAYEAACNGMIESYTKKMNEMKETESAEDAGAVE